MCLCAFRLGPFVAYYASTPPHLPRCAPYNKHQLYISPYSPNTQNTYPMLDIRYLQMEVTTTSKVLKKFFKLTFPKKLTWFIMHIQ